MSFVERMRTLYRFRRALGRASDDEHMYARLLVWRSLCTVHGFAFEPAVHLGESVLHGSYLGVPVKIHSYFEEIRVITCFSVTLPEPPSSALLARVNEPAYLHEQTRVLLDECATRVKLTEAQAAAVRASFDAHTAHLALTETSLVCGARYVHSAAEHTKLLTALFALARAIRVPD